MPSIVPIQFSGGVNGRGIKVAAIVTPGTLIHATSAVASVLDEIWLYAENIDTVTRTVTIEFGGTAAAGDDIVQAIPPGQGVFIVVPGVRLGGAGALTIGAFCPTANVIIITGNVNRWNP